MKYELPSATLRRHASVPNCRSALRIVAQLFFVVLLISSGTGRAGDRDRKFKSTTLQNRPEFSADFKKRSLAFSRNAAQQPKDGSPTLAETVKWLESALERGSQSAREYYNSLGNARVVEDTQVVITQEAIVVTSSSVVPSGYPKVPPIRFFCITTIPLDTIEPLSVTATRWVGDTSKNISFFGFSFQAKAGTTFRSESEGTTIKSEWEIQDGKKTFHKHQFSFARDQELCERARSAFIHFLSLIGSKVDPF